MISRVTMVTFVGLFLSASVFAGGVGGGGHSGKGGGGGGKGGSSSSFPALVEIYENESTGMQCKKCDQRNCDGEGKGKVRYLRFDQRSLVSYICKRIKEQSQFGIRSYRGDLSNDLE